LRDLVEYRLLNFDGMRPDLTVHAGGRDVETWAESYETTNGTSLINDDGGPLAGRTSGGRPEGQRRLNWSVVHAPIETTF